MKETSEAFLAKAERALGAAESLLREGHGEFASGHRWLLDAHDARLADDYGFESAMTAEDVRMMLNRAAEFLAAAKGWLAGQ